MHSWTYPSNWQEPIDRSTELETSDTGQNGPHEHEMHPAGPNGTNGLEWNQWPQRAPWLNRRNLAFYLNARPVLLPGTLRSTSTRALLYSREPGVLPRRAPCFTPGNLAFYLNAEWLEHRNQALRLHVVNPLEQGMLFGSLQPQFGPTFAGMLGEELHHRFLPP
jgi:hypothetical protein